MPEHPQESAALLFEAQCAICDSKGADALLDRASHTLVRCWECGHVFFWPLPTEQQLNEFYSSEQGYLPHIRWLWEDQQRRWEEVVESKRHYVRQAASEVFGEVPGRSLEVGCAHGAGLLGAKEEGWEPCGVEVCEESAKVAREKFGFPVFSGTLQQARYPEGHFGLALMFMTLEHFLDPLAVLREVRRVLAPGGALLVTTPNIESTMARRLKDKWEWIAYPNHLHYFAPATIARAFERAGLETAQVSTTTGDANWDQLLTVIKEALALDADEEVQQVVPALAKLKRLPQLEAIARKA